MIDTQTLEHYITMLKPTEQRNQLFAIGHILLNIDKELGLIRKALTAPVVAKEKPLTGKARG